jgi:hypothetical protein
VSSLITSFIGGTLLALWYTALLVLVDKATDEGPTSTSPQQAATR